MTIIRQSKIDLSIKLYSMKAIELYTIVCTMYSVHSDWYCTTVVQSVCIKVSEIKQKKQQKFTVTWRNKIHNAR